MIRLFLVYDRDSYHCITIHSEVCSTISTTAIPDARAALGSTCASDANGLAESAASRGVGDAVGAQQTDEMHSQSESSASASNTCGADAGAKASASASAMLDASAGVVGAEFVSLPTPLSPSHKRATDTSVDDLRRVAQMQEEGTSTLLYSIRCFAYVQLEPTVAVPSSRIPIFFLIFIPNNFECCCSLPTAFFLSHIRMLYIVHYTEYLKSSYN